MKVYIDVETYCEVDLKKTGVYPYFESPSFKILLIGYAVDDGPVVIVKGSYGGSMFIDICRRADELIAHNATFERLAFRAINFDLPNWTCTMIKAAFCGLPMGLEVVGEALNLTTKKAASGKALIRYFSMPCKPTKSNGGRTRNLPEHDPEKWRAFKDYLRDDVETTRDLHKALSRYEFTEQNNYILDQKINDRGVLLDRVFINSAIELDRVSTIELKNEAKNLTGLDNPNSPAQLASWLSDLTGNDVSDLRKDTVNDMLASATGPVKRALELRQKTSNTSVKKYGAAAQYICEDGRARGLFQFYGAGRTARWAGRGVQVQNMPRNYMQTLDEARELVRQGDTETLAFLYNDLQNVLKELTRTMLIAGKGKKLLVADFSAIEARVLAWLAGEEWRLEVFRTHGKIYEASAAAMFNIPIESIDKGSPYRQKGKVAELALGYQGGVGALIAMGAEAMGLTEPEMKQIVVRWRRANPATASYWQIIDGAAKRALRNPTKVVRLGSLKFTYDRNALIITLPSGRPLIYQQPKLAEGRYGEVIKFMGVDAITKRWVLIDTYGGKLVENIVQAVARDLLAFSMQSVDAAGFDIVLHVHDEIVAEDSAEACELKLDKLIAEMIKKPDWALDLPLGADGFICDFYKKD
jgi:DNA polymerase